MEKQSKAPKIEKRIGKHFKVFEKINNGAFGEVYRGINEKTQIEVAVKYEPASTKRPQLFMEFKLYEYLLRDPMVIDKGIPNIYYCSTIGDYHVMVMDLLGPSLEDLFIYCRKKMSLKTVLMLADQLIQRIEYIHSKYLLHRDIKPDNFLIGVNQNSHKVFCIDFGLAKKYLQRDGSHIEYKEGKKLTGTARYASINTHIGIEQARRDDLESLGYMLMYFLRGILPWQNLQATDKKDKYEKIKEKKLSTSVDTLCQGYPVEFATYLKYCRNLEFEEKPNYQYLRKLFKDLFKKQGFEMDYVYDWNIIAEEENHKESQKNNNGKIPNINTKQLVDKKKK